MLIVPLSLSDRFRGALLGAAVGEILGANHQHRLNRQTPSSWLEVDQWGFEDLAGKGGFSWGRLAIEQIRSVTQLQQNFSLPIRNDLGLTIAALPIALFHHDDWQKLQTVVQENLANDPYPSHLSTAILAIGYTLCLTLQAQLHPPGLIPQLIAALDLSNTLPLLAQQLDQVQIWHQDKVDLSTARTLISHITAEASVPTPVTIALHSFLQTPTNFQTALLRTARLNHQPQIACALVGALSGAYNGVGAIPLLWRNRLQSVVNQSSVLSTFWQISSEAELLQYADLLLATWSGVDSPQSWIPSPQSLVTASPGTIRPR